MRLEILEKLIDIQIYKDYIENICFHMYISIYIYMFVQNCGINIHNKMYNLEQIANQRITFGKHKNKTLLQIIDNQSDYADWIINNKDFKSDNQLQQKLKLLKNARINNTNKNSQEYRFTFGKYNSLTFKQVNQIDPQYIDWIINHQSWNNSQLQSKLKQSRLSQSRNNSVNQRTNIYSSNNNKGVEKINIKLEQDPLKKFESIKNKQINNIIVNQKNFEELPVFEQISKIQKVEEQQIYEYLCKIKKLEDMENQKNRMIEQLQQLLNKLKQQNKKKNIQVEQLNILLNNYRQQNKEKSLEINKLNQVLNKQTQLKNIQINELNELLNKKQKQINYKNIQIDQLNEELNKQMLQKQKLKNSKEQSLNYQKIIDELQKKYQYQVNLKNKLLRDIQDQNKNYLAKIQKIQQQAQQKYQKQINQLQLSKSLQKHQLNQTIQLLKSQSVKLNQKYFQSKHKQMLKFTFIPIIVIILILILGKILI